jgi:hypothetical protein
LICWFFTLLYNRTYFQGEFMTFSIGQQRLAHHLLVPPPLSTPLDVVRWMGALQAQDYHQAVWAIAVRLPNATLAHIEQAISDAQIVRTWTMRGTIHFAPAEDAKWMVQIGAKRVNLKSRQAELNLDEDTFKRSEEIFQRALDGGKTLSRDALMQLLDDNHLHPQDQRGYHILLNLAQKGVLCITATVDKQQTFALLDQWAKPTPTRTYEETVIEMTRRFFQSHAPATVQDFVWWTGVTLKEARNALDALKDFHMERVNGIEYWYPNELPQAIETHSALLLPGFDEYLLGYKDRSAVLNPVYANQVSPGGNGVFTPMLVLDGQIIGTWKRTLKKTSVSIEFKPFEPLNLSQRTRLEEAAQRYGLFHGLSVVFE